MDAVRSVVWAALVHVVEAGSGVFAVCGSWFTAVFLALVGELAVVVTVWLITAVFLTLVGVFAVWCFWWAANVGFWNALSVTFLFSVFTAESILGDTLLSGFTACFSIIATAVLNASVVLSWAVEGGIIAAWFVLWPAFTVAVDFVVVTAEGVGAWLTVLLKVSATDVVLVFTTANWVSIGVFDFLFVDN